jgi:hypothetical protein
VGGRLRQAGKTQQELADEVEVSRQTTVVEPDSFVPFDRARYVSPNNPKPRRPGGGLLRNQLIVSECPGDRGLILSVIRVNARWPYSKDLLTRR